MNRRVAAAGRVVGLFVLLSSTAWAQEPQALTRISLEDVQRQSSFARSLIPAEAGLLQAEAERIRSPQRTWTGAVLLGGGTVLALHSLFSTCADNAIAAAVFDQRTCGQAATLFGTGVGVAVVGTLLMTVLSDVPANPSADGLTVSW